MDFIYIDMKDGTGGFMIPDDGKHEDVVEELLKDEKYMRREEQKKYFCTVCGKNLCGKVRIQNDKLGYCKCLEHGLGVTKGCK